MVNPHDVKQNRKFGYTVSIALLVLAAFHIFIKHHAAWWVGFTIAIILLVCALVKPSLLNLLRLIWDKIGHILGIINTYILLTVFYFLILTPLGIIMRLFGKDILKVKQSAKLNSYWDISVQKADSSMKNQF